jgi:hypothetical protein
MELRRVCRALVKAGIVKVEGLRRAEKVIGIPVVGRMN